MKRPTVYLTRADFENADQYVRYLEVWFTMSDDEIRATIRRGQRRAKRGWGPDDE